MFPPQIPRVFVEWLTEIGEVVYDPFSGRGTAPMEACRLGRVGLGSDANPLAHVLTGSKVDPPTLRAITKRLDALAGSAPSRLTADVPDAIRMLYSPGVMRQLCSIRARLDVRDRTDRFIMCTVLGIMHANYSPGAPPRGLSVSMPNTFSMSAGYVRRYIAAHRLRPPDVDVIAMVRRKIARMCIPLYAARRGRAWKADARDPIPLSDRDVKLVFTSPPYLGVIKYGKYNWIRLWMLGYEPRDVDNALIATASLSRYLEFMDAVLDRLTEVVRSDGYVCLMIGDVANSGTSPTLNLVNAVWHTVAQRKGWRRLGILNDQLPQHRKVSRIWGHEKRGHATKVDRILILAPPGSRHRLPPRPRTFDWGSADTWATKAYVEEE